MLLGVVLLKEKAKETTVAECEGFTVVNLLINEREV